MGQPSKGIYKPRKVNPVRDQIIAALRVGDATVNQLAATTGRNRETIFNHVHDLLHTDAVHICALDTTHSGPPARTFRLGPCPPCFTPERVTSIKRRKPHSVPDSPPPAPLTPPPQHPIIAALFRGYAP